FTIVPGSSGIYTGHRLVVPRGALTSNKTIIIKNPDTTIIPSSMLEETPSAVQIEVRGSETQFNFEDSVYLTVEYKPFEVLDDEDNMRIHVWDTAKGAWKRVMGEQSVNDIEKTVTAKIKHLSIYGAIEVMPGVQSTSALEQGWIMLSVPVEPEDADDLEALFGDDVRPFMTDPYNSNIYRYDEPTNNWIVPSVIQNGIGYILYCYNGNIVDVSGLAVTGDVTKILTYTGGNGWHLAGNPYAVGMDWDSDVSIDAGIDNIYYRWIGSHYDNYPYGDLTRQLAKWEGFWVHTTVDSAEMTISYPGVSKKARQERIRPLLDWRIKIIAESGGNKDIHNYIGTSIDADIEYDAADVYELNPLSQEFISLYFPHTEWEENPGNFTQDIRPFVDSTLTWDFSVAAVSNSESAELKWFIPQEFDYSIYLYNAENGDKIDMLETDSYSYTIKPALQKASNDKNTNTFSPAGFSDRLKKAAADINNFSITLKKNVKQEAVNIPSVYYLHQNYPNPFNP
ncbi:hypothetical protein KAS50_01020, partial [bacterium]|nr:hypothetical protein [bacterium]